MRRISQFAVILVGVTAFLGAAGCGRSSREGSGSSAPPANAQGDGPLEQVLRLWRDGDRAAAVKRLVGTDWKSGRIARPGSPLSRRESDLAPLSASAREGLLNQVDRDLRDLKELANAVRDEAAATLDKRLAQRLLGSLDACGTALARPDKLKIVQSVGETLRKMAAAESAKR